MTPRLASLVAVGLVAGAVGLTGCGGSHATQMNNLIRTGTLPSLHSASRHYSADEVALAFDLHGLPLRNVSPKDYAGQLVLLDGRPRHLVYVYVEVGKFSGLLDPAIRHAHVIHHGNVEVLWRGAEGSAVRAALRALD